MVGDWNPYYAAFASDNCRTPEQQHLIDGGSQHEFIVWIGRQWRQFFAAHNLPSSANRSAHADAFGAWLREQVR